MNSKLAKEMLNACYTAKRARDLLPKLPNGVSASFIHVLDVLDEAQKLDKRLRVSNLSDILGVKRPVMTRTINDMESRGYIQKLSDKTDGRVVYITATENGKKLSERFNTKFFDELVPLMDEISDEEAQVMIATANKLYKAMSRVKNLFS